jgi:hypothetical protein
MTRQPLYPHVSRKTAPRVPGQYQDITLRFLPDSPELLTQTMNNTGLRARLDSVFQEAINRAKGA